MQNDFLLCWLLWRGTKRFTDTDETKAGFHAEEGGPWNSPSPRNLEIEYGYYRFVTGIKQQSCPKLRQKQSKFKIFLGEHAPRPL